MRTQPRINGCRKSGCVYNSNQLNTVPARNRDEMATFDDRKKGFENKYQHDQEMLFKIQNRRNKLLGQWAADLLGKSGEDADEYAKEVVLSDFEAPGDDDVHDKVSADLEAANVDLSDHRLRKKMDELLAVAHDQVMSEGT